jgi:hypothetical protein
MGGAEGSASTIVLDPAGAPSIALLSESGGVLASMTETDADRFCLLPDRAFCPLQGFGDLRDRGP